MNNQIKNILRVFAIIICLEILSLIVFLNSGYSDLVFLLISLSIIAISFWKLEYGILILFSELIIGSKGYLFSIELGGKVFSIRMVFWAVVMLAWFLKWGQNAIKTRDFKSTITSIKSFPQYKFYLILFISITWGLVNALINRNGLSNIFFDSNAWLYFLLIFPIFSVYNNLNENKIKNLTIIIVGALLASSFKTFFLLYFFTHGFGDFLPIIYKWVRDTGVGEITRMESGFARVFFQSHIYFLVAFFVFISLKYTEYKEKIIGSNWIEFLFLIFIITVNILTYSRSNWLGGVLGIYFFITYLIYKKENLKSLFFLGLNIFIATLLSLVLILAIIKIPYPGVHSRINVIGSLSERASEFKGEAAVSSRWALLPEINTKLKESFLLGEGFGETVTYKSSDPRILENNPGGEYTTFAFEWGWLDIWLKIGIFGLFAYLMIFYNLFLNLLRTKQFNFLQVGIVFGLITLVFVNFFSPYLNHPLGIGIVLLSSVILCSKNLANFK